MIIIKEKITENKLVNNEADYNWIRTYDFTGNSMGLSILFYLIKIVVIQNSDIKVGIKILNS